jgi:hypothetical protein
MDNSVKTHHVYGDIRGNLIALESENDVPFEIKRVFFIYGAPQDISRGEHSHHRTKQYLIALSGSCQVTLDDGQTQKTHILDSPAMGLLQDAMIWGTMHNFSHDCVLLVLASEHYDDSDYIRNYRDFIKIISN